MKKIIFNISLFVSLFLFGLSSLMAQGGKDSLFKHKKTINTSFYPNSYSVINSENTYLLSVTDSNVIIYDILNKKTSNTIPLARLKELGIYWIQYFTSDSIIWCREYVDPYNPKYRNKLYKYNCKTNKVLDSFSIANKDKIQIINDYLLYKEKDSIYLKNLITKEIIWKDLAYYTENTTEGSYYLSLDVNILTKKTSIIQPGILIVYDIDNKQANIKTIHLESPSLEIILDYSFQNDKAVILRKTNNLYHILSLYDCKTNKYQILAENNSLHYGGLTIQGDSLFVVNNKGFIKVNEPYTIEIYDIKSGKYLKSILNTISKDIRKIKAKDNYILLKTYQSGSVYFLDIDSGKVVHSFDNMYDQPGYFREIFMSIYNDNCQINTGPVNIYGYDLNKNTSYSSLFAA